MDKHSVEHGGIPVIGYLPFGSTDPMDMVTQYDVCGDPQHPLCAGQSSDIDAFGAVLKRDVKNEDGSVTPAGTHVLVVRRYPLHA